MQWADAETWCRPGAAGCMQCFRRSGPCPCREPIGPRQRAPLYGCQVVSSNPHSCPLYPQKRTFCAAIKNVAIRSPRQRTAKWVFTPAKFSAGLSQTNDFVINLKTAKALGLNVPPSLLAIAADPFFVNRRDQI